MGMALELGFGLTAAASAGAASAEAASAEAAAMLNVNVNVDARRQARKGRVVDKGDVGFMAGVAGVKSKEQRVKSESEERRVKSDCGRKRRERWHGHSCLCNFEEVGSLEDWCNSNPCQESWFVRANGPISYQPSPQGWVFIWAL